MPNVLIVGATSGIGKAVSEGLDASWNQWTLSRSTAGPASARHGIWDARGEDFPPDFLPERLDGLVYCPGGIRLRPFGMLKDRDFLDDLQVHLLGAVRAIRAALPALKAAPAASVVLFSSAAVSTGMPMHTSVAASKGAVEGLARSLAAELAPATRVNAIAPSLTDTPLAAGLLRTGKQRQAAAERHPLNRLGAPGDLAAAVRFLLTPDSGWITGQVLHVDGGITALRRFT